MNNKITEEIIKNYERKEEGIIAELKMTNKNHGTTIGNYREDVWANLFRNLLPKKFSVVTNSFIIGVDNNDVEGETLSNACISPEIDIVIFDEYYVPYIFQYGETSKIIPIEAVIAIVQCKSIKIGNAKKWLKSVKSIYPSVKTAKARQYNGKLVGNEMNEGKFRKTKPISILCSTGDNEIDEFDISIGIKEEKLFISSKLLKYKFEDISNYLNNGNELKESESIDDWECFKKVNNELLKLSFILNQLAMLINNPLIFDHPAYAKIFSSEERGK